MSSFRDSMLYPIVFMLITCLIFVGVLAVMYRSSVAKIDAYQKDSYQQLVLGLFAEAIGFATETKPYHIVNDYPDAYNSYIKEVKLQGLERRAFTATVGDSLLGYCFDIGGKGLWGSMRALIALSPDLKTLQGMVIYDQMETPGLGGRIGEEWFLTQFKNIPIIDSNQPTTPKIVDFELIPEGKKAANPKQIQQITGATITSTSVLKMLKTEITLILVASDVPSVALSAADKMSAAMPSVESFLPSPISSLPANFKAERTTHDFQATQALPPVVHATPKIETASEKGRVASTPWLQTTQDSATQALPLVVHATAKIETALEKGRVASTPDLQTPDSGTTIFFPEQL